MTVNEILEQAKQLSPDERQELARRLLAIDDAPAANGEQTPSEQTQHWGKSLNQLLDETEAIELVDPHIKDPVEWVKAQRRKEQERLKPYWEDEPE